MKKSKWVAVLLLILIFLLGARLLRWENAEEVSKSSEEYSLKIRYLTDRWSGQRWVRLYGVQLGKDTTFLGGVWHPIIGNKVILSPKEAQETEIYDKAHLIKQALSISWIFATSAIVITLLILILKEETYLQVTRKENNIEK